MCINNHRLRNLRPFRLAIIFSNNLDIYYSIKVKEMYHYAKNTKFVVFYTRGFGWHHWLRGYVVVATLKSAPGNGPTIPTHRLCF